MKKSILLAKCKNSILVAILCVKLGGYHNPNRKLHGAAKALDKMYRAKITAVC